jgi:hypothetical protein
MKKNKDQVVAKKSTEATAKTSTHTIKTIPTKYVVIRDNYRVSDREYEAFDDPNAINELQFWTRVANNHSYKEPVKIAVYDPKKHRVW